ncbi:hypothetical protein [Burkholderia ambifaria]|uniref:hypothetical protein n=1 Tax=Burkholderia ambifaria TaxID=152480 RepID=UPI00158F30D9|nr:hypothetical protein [Burkholderia ambifaria]
MRTEFIWWEKTVEYAFILETAGKLDFAAPLSGVHERAGDGIFASDSKLVLIEFKRDETQLNSERDKFVDFERAAETLGPRGGHHFVVFGYQVVENGNAKPHLSLAVERFFSGPSPKDMDAMFKAGLPKDSFNVYLNELIDLKNKDGRSSGAIGASNYASVFGISASQGAKTVALQDYLVREMNYELKMDEPQSTHVFSPPGP